jgi:hypothetical protein
VETPAIILWDKCNHSSEISGTNELLQRGQLGHIVPAPWPTVIDPEIIAMIVITAPNVAKKKILGSGCLDFVEP